MVYSRPAACALEETGVHDIHKRHDISVVCARGLSWYKGKRKLFCSSTVRSSSTSIEIVTPATSLSIALKCRGCHALRDRQQVQCVTHAGLMANARIDVIFTVLYSTWRLLRMPDHLIGAPPQLGHCWMKKEASEKKTNQDARNRWVHCEHFR